jgi:uncharacterized protein (TIGR00369 family)
MSNLLSIDEIQERISASPFNRWLDLRISLVAVERIVLRCNMKPELVGSPTTQAVHGGVLAALVDCSASFAVISRTGQSVATIDQRVDYHRPGIARELVAEATVLRLGRRLATIDTHICDEAGTLIASGRTLMMQVPHKSKDGDVETS